jgi:hypothetical protein
MKHLSEEQLVTHYYGDGEVTAARQHLAECGQCAMEFQRIKKVLGTVRVPRVPERSDEYGRDVWQRIRTQLPEREPRNAWWQSLLPNPQGFAWAGAVAVLVIAAFVAGRFWQQKQPITPGNVATSGAPQARERIVLVAVGDHLEQSQMMLVELMNTDVTGPVNIAGEQTRARELLSANRLYRQSAERLDDPAVNKVLDDLERVLLEISNGPSELNAQDVAQLRKRLQSQGILFEIRVIGSKVRQKERPAQSTAPEQRKT